MSTVSDTKEGFFPVSSSIRRKLTAIIMGVSSVALVFAGGLIVLSQMTAFRKNMAVDHVLQTKMIANNCLAAVSFDDSLDASLVLRTLSSRPSLACASVTKADGKILAVYRRPGFSGEPQAFSSDGAYKYTSEWLIAQEPIVLDGRTIGTVFLQSDLSELSAFKQQIMKIVTGSLLVVILLTWVVSFNLQRLVSAPIERLTGVVRNVSRRRDYSIRAEHSGRDEIGVLARSFNEMLSEVELRDEKLLEREQRTQEYLNIAGVMIVALDPEGQVSLINPKGCAIIGLQEADILGKNWFGTFVPERLREKTINYFNGLIKGERTTSENYESEVLAGNGEERLIAWKNSVIRNEAGRIILTISSGEDITDRRQAEEREAALREQLVRAERMESIGVLAGGVAHDLNNILGPMVMLPEFIAEDMNAAMQGDASAQAAIRDSLSVLNISGNRAASVVRDLLSLSRRGHYELAPADINKMACLTCGSSCIRSLCESYPNVEIRLCVSSEALTVLASEDHLCRVIDNLIRNAVESIDGKGSVTVTTSKKHLHSEHNGYMAVPAGDYAVIQVADTGSGIEEDHLSRIFEPFYTKKKKTDNSGSGLGLSIVHGIVEDHDGFIDVQSKVGRGTTFTLYLPLTRSGVIRYESDERLPVTGNGSVLVVDDEPGQRFLASKCLTRLGYTVGLAEDGVSAVRLFADAKLLKSPAPYDLIVLDMRMERGFDGLDAMVEIRALYPEQKVLIVSGHAEDDRSIAALALGAKWLAKPYALIDLARAVAELLQIKEIM